MATNSIEECRQIRRQLERERQRETCQPHNGTIQAKRKRTTERERRASLTTELRNMDRSSNSEQHRQIRERRASEEREQHRWTNSEKRRVINASNILLNLPKYCVIEITTPVDCPGVSLVYIIIVKSQ